MSTDRPKGPDSPPTDATELPEEARVHDLLPPSEEEWAPPMKRIAERRVGGWQTSSRLFQRRTFRPAGNSRKFWRKVEDDDPFLPQPPGKRSPQEGHGVYAADRLVRMPDAPKVERPTEYAPPPPQPRRQAPPPRQEPPRQTRPEPTYTEEPRPAPPPRSRPPAPAPAEEEVETIDRRPPRIPHNPGGRSKAGRMRVGPTNAPARETKVVDKWGRSATEARQEREQWREEAKGPKAPPPLRGYDDVLSILGDLAASQKLYEAGIKGREDTDRVEAPRPKPKRVVPPQSSSSPPSPPPVDRTPPKPKPSPKPVNRSPSGGGGGGGLDDLFGGGPSEGRMRIPKRSKKTDEEDEEG